MWKYLKGHLFGHTFESLTAPFHSIAAKLDAHYRALHEKADRAQAEAVKLTDEAKQTRVEADQVGAVADKIAALVRSA